VQDYKESMDWAIQMGTPGSVYHHEKSSNLPVRNFQDPRFPDAKSIDGKLMAATIRPTATPARRARSTASRSSSTTAAPSPISR
jgi:aldehyde:ferredoxin oxidoreductase